MSKSIAIVAPSSVPFQVGGAEKFWWGLREALGNMPGHFAELIKLPCREECFADIVQAYKNFYSLDLGHFDMVISSKYPAWMTRHPNHALYMQHTLRGLYDTYHFSGLRERVDGAPRSLDDLLAHIRKRNIENGDVEKAFELCEAALKSRTIPSAMFAFPGPLIREVVHFLDRAAMGNISAFLAISENVRGRKDYFPEQADIKVLPHPTDLACIQREGGEYIFTASRLNATKRVGLIIDAMQHVKKDIPLKIAGIGPELEHLKLRAGGDGRIEFLGYVPDEEMAALYANSLFTVFVPYDEDYGLITIEAMQSGKPVVTAEDSGGPCEFVQDGLTGLRARPEPAALGAAMERLAANPALANEMGKRARKSVEKISWPDVAGALLVHASNSRIRQCGLPRVVVAAPFPANAGGSGGEQRLFHFCAALSRQYYVVLVCMGSQKLRRVESSELAPNFMQICLPWSEAEKSEAKALLSATGASCDDMVILRHCAQNAQLLEILRNVLDGAFSVVLSHPWLLPAIEATDCRLPLAYDAHNVEADLKREIFGESGRELAREAARIEEKCCHRATRVFGCTSRDLERLGELYGVPGERLRLLPNGCGTFSLAHSHDRRRLRKKLAFPQARLALFLGSGHPPNVEAARFIIKMAASLPDIQFILAGSASTQDSIRLMEKPPNAHLAGIVSESVKNILLGACDVGLNPMAAGSGSNIKIMEYLAAGLECISTPCGMRGIGGDFSNVAHVCELEDFPAAVRQVFSRPSPGTLLDEAAARAASLFDWRQTMRPLAEIFR